MILVFTYGSLKRGFQNHSFLEGSRFVAEATSADRSYYMWSGGYFPFAAECASGAAVRGEVFEVDEATLARLDRLEGHPQFYCRRERKFDCDDGVERTAWVYLIPDDQVPPSTFLAEDGVLEWKLEPELEA